MALAIYEQYTPASTEDEIPVSVEGQLLGLADRIQTIVAMFGIGNAPTGSKDPFALRRAANAIVKILAEAELPLTLGDVLNASSAEGGNKAQVEEFLRERLHFYLKDVRGFAYDVVNAVLAAGADDVRDAIARAEALTAARGSEDFLAVSAAFKRIKNILKQAEEKGFAVGSPKSAETGRGGAAVGRRCDGSGAAGGRASRAAGVRRVAGRDRLVAARCGRVLRQGDGARSRSRPCAGRTWG